MLRWWRFSGALTNVWTTMCCLNFNSGRSWSMALASVVGNLKSTSCMSPLVGSVLACVFFSLWKKECVSMSSWSCHYMSSLPRMYTWLPEFLDCPCSGWGMRLCCVRELVKAKYHCVESRLSSIHCRGQCVDWRPGCNFLWLFLRTGISSVFVGLLRMKMHRRFVWRSSRSLWGS